MADRVPLILNNTNSTIQELPTGDDLDVTSANIKISNIANLRIPGGTSGQGIVTDGAGNLSFGSVTSTPSGSNTQIQFNDAGAFGASSNLTFNKTNSTLSVPNVSVSSNLSVTGNASFTGSNVSLGAIGNVKITGGTVNQVLRTDGAGNLSFASVGGGDSYMLAPVDYATTSNLNPLVGAVGLQDGQTVTVGDRVLVWRQTTSSENGIYIVQSGAWTRTSDFNTGAATLQGGVTVTARRGNFFGGVTFVCTNTTAITIGTTSITFNQIENNGYISIWQGPGLFSKAVGATNSGATAMGIGANASVDSVAIGFNAYGNGASQTVTIGYGANGTQANGTVVGWNTFASGGNSVALGSNARAGTASISIGRNSNNQSGSNSIAIGFGSISVGNGVAMGSNSQVNSGNAVAIGTNSIVTTSLINGVALGHLSRVESSYGVAIGDRTVVTSAGFGSLAVGTGANSSASRAVAVGTDAVANGENSAALGPSTRTTTANSISIGYLANGNSGSSIVLNATGASMGAAGASTTAIKPVRAVTDITGLKQIYYNPTTGELVYYNV